jgi:hypothetical protein
MTKTNASRTTALLSGFATAALLTVTLSACTQGATEAVSKPAATEAAVEAPPVALEGDLDGNSSVSEWEKSMLAKHAARDYTLADGTTVTVDPAQPLPAQVIEEVKAAGSASASGLRTSSVEPYYAAYDALIATLDAKAAATGHGFIVVAKGSTIWVAVASGATNAPLAGSTDKGTAVAQATEWAAARGFELIVY